MAQRLARSLTGAPRWLGVLSLALLLLSSCTTARAPRARGLGPAAGAPQPGEVRALAPVATGGDMRLVSLPTRFAPVRLSEMDFALGLVQLVVDTPLPLALAAPREQPVRPLSLLAGALVAQRQPSELVRDYGRFCERCGTPGDCLTLLGDGHLDFADRRRIALALALRPSLEAMQEELHHMVSPTRVLTMVTVSVATYMVLLVAPEPLSKGLAAAATVLLWGYLGWEFWDLLKGFMQLSEEVAEATTFGQLREAGERYARVLGPNTLRIMVLLSTAAVGETAALLSKARKLPGFQAAAHSVEVHGGMRLLEAAAGAERVIVSAPPLRMPRAEGSLRLVLPANALAMTLNGPGGGGASSGGGARPTPGTQSPGGHRAFKSFEDFKKAMGKAGEGKEWHHIVEQHQGNLTRFGPEALHNTENCLRLELRIHREINRIYSTKQADMGNMTIRDWLRTRSYEQQRDFGLKILQDLGVMP